MTRPTAIQALCFDLDNTLVDRNGVWSRFHREWLAEQPRVPAAARTALFRQLMDLDGFGLGSRDDQDCFLAAHWDFSAADIAAKHRQWVVAIPRLFPRDPARCDLLHRLAARFPLALVNNGGSQTQRAKLAASGLGSCFAADGLFLSAECGAAKPEPAIFRAALAWLGIPAENTLFIGDDPQRDILGAAALGMKTCWLANPHLDPVTADWTIDSIFDLEPLLYA
ncbi:HAD family hydrolase [Acanthopleuribacter pedis]|uniref:HAD family hydrolase n=1 Tax=Acanthopleuribacter pedis TaxID=442870 RepID=A0A8J7QR15_9BACT|nr:HAD family hydrolase [Acanthopleuribacter pedis]MBO1322615.1 HAD family hydrolase [Acanthopleuribacter pedis]